MQAKNACSTPAFTKFTKRLGIILGMIGRLAKIVLKFQPFGKNGFLFRRFECQKPNLFGHRKIHPI